MSLHIIYLCLSVLMHLAVLSKVHALLFVFVLTIVHFHKILSDISVQKNICFLVVTAYHDIMKYVL